MEIAIEVKNLTKSFGNIYAVNNLNLCVKKGTIYGLVGPDGAGKTTTIRILTGVISSTSGLAKILNIDVLKNPEKVREKIGYMPQQFSLYSDLTVEENLEFFADLYGVSKAEREKRKLELYEFSKLAPFKKRYAGALSGGMKKKLSLACTLIHTPEILFLDEPTTGVDPLSRRELWRILYLLVPKVTIFVSTPYMDEAERCNEVGLMFDGRILLSDTPEGIKRKMIGNLLVLKCSRLREAKQALLSLPEIKKVELFGDKLHVVVTHISSAFESITKKLKELNIEIFSLREGVPTLEDIFVSLVSR